MPFCDAMKLFEYWADYPPVHMMVRDYLGYEGTVKEPTNNPVEVAAAMQAITGAMGRAPKVSTAPARDRERFAALKEQMKKGKDQ